MLHSFVSMRRLLQSLAVGFVVIGWQTNYCHLLSRFGAATMFAEDTNTYIGPNSVSVS